MVGSVAWILFHNVISGITHRPQAFNHCQCYQAELPFAMTWADLGASLSLSMMEFFLLVKTFLVLQLVMRLVFLKETNTWSSSGR